MPAVSGYVRGLIDPASMGESYHILSTNILTGVVNSRSLSEDERVLLSRLGEREFRNAIRIQDDEVNRATSPLGEDEADGPYYEEEVGDDRPEPPTPARRVPSRYVDPTSPPQPSQPAQYVGRVIRSRPPRTRGNLVPLGERSRRIINTLPLYIEAVKKRIQLWKIMEEISVALEQSLADINRFELSDSQIDGVACGLEEESVADGLTVEEMCDALRIDHPDMGERDEIPY